MIANMVTDSHSFVSNMRLDKLYLALFSSSYSPTTVRLSFMFLVGEFL